MNGLDTKAPASAGGGQPESASVRRSLHLVTLGGCLAMVFIAGITSPAWTEFFRAVGATELHFGLLGGIPMAALIFQFVGAVLANRVPRRRPIFMTVSIVSRALCIPIVLLPLLMPNTGIDTVMAVVLVCIAVSAILGQLAVAPWFSWMADLVPHKVLNRYWGARLAWMTATWAVCYVGVAAYTRLLPWDIRVIYPPLVVIAVAAGIIDILLFVRVEEPANHTVKDLPVLRTLLAPLRDRQYRLFVIYSCFRAVAMMVAAAFMQLYCLKVLGLPLWQVTIAWCLSGIGNTVTARLWGRMADRHGHKPIMAICDFFKPAIALVFLLITPRTAFWVIPPVFLIDGAWNSGHAIASNGFMMKLAPRRNRSMFIAALMGPAGLFGGLAAMAGGIFLHAVDGFEIQLLNRTWSNYHALFAICFALRIMNAAVVHVLREPASSHPFRVLNDMRGVWPYRFLRFPVGLYRRWNTAENGEA